jgi:PAS domain S-box-containing protein
MGGPEIQHQLRSISSDAYEQDEQAAGRVPAGRFLASWAPVWGPLATGATYFLAAKAGESLAFPSAPLSAFWAPNAIVLAALVLAQPRRWPIYLLAVLPFHLAAQLPGFPATRVLIQYLLNSAEALIGAFAIVRFCTHPFRYDHLRTAFVLIVFGGIVGPLLTSAVMAAAFFALDLSDEFWTTFVARTITNTFAVVALVPLIVHASRSRRRIGQISLRRAVEASALALALTTVGVLVFVLPAEGSHSPALLYAPLPVLVWAAVRFGVTGACTAVLLVGAISTWGVLNGRGPFAARDPVGDAFALVSFHAVIAIVFVLLAALLEEWRTGARELARSETRFRNIFESNIVPTLIWHGDFRISDVNDAFLRLTGYLRADFEAGRMPLDELEAWCRDLPAAATTTAEPPRLFRGSERELPVRDGRRVPVVAASSTFSSQASGGIVYVLDLSASRRAEAERIQAEGLHAAVLASLHDQVAILDATGRVVELNPSWQRFVETADASRFDRVSKGESFLNACARAAERGDAAALEHLSALRAVLDGSIARRQLELPGMLAGRSYWLDVTIETLRHPQGGAVVSRADMTAHKLAQSEARTQRQQLAHLGRAAVLGQLSGAFAHELNQPLTSIRGNAEAALRLLARGAGVPEEIEEILRDIVHDDERAAQVIQGLRSLLQKGESNRQPVDLNAIVGEVLELASGELVARNVAVSTELRPHLPPVDADPIQMQQIVLNLIMNAAEAMSTVPATDRRISIRTMLDPPESCVQLTVSDSGCGIAPEDLERIFQPFATTKPHGLGLGLTICRSVAQSHQGQLWAENAGDGGAVLHLRIPYRG